MKYLDWIAVTAESLSAAPQMLGNIAFYSSICWCDWQAHPSRMQFPPSPSRMLIIFLIGLLDSVTSARAANTPGLFYTLIHVDGYIQYMHMSRTYFIGCFRVLIKYNCTSWFLQ
jgi:hypothetical protein